MNTLKIRLWQRFRCVKASKHIDVRTFQTKIFNHTVGMIEHRICELTVILVLGKKFSLLESMGWLNSQTSPRGNFCSAGSLCSCDTPEHHN